MNKPDIQPELIQLMKEEMTRLHEIIKKEGNGNTTEKKWAMEELTKIHNALYAMPVVVPNMDIETGLSTRHND